ncbi:OLC1v1032548C1 [Oldenlandia corymbosa var. corymbosa]|uniref:OLC1v1032548C1 n=1 Tax=Oldenlandia corymbosa var. corymbosa TaxID=529605 RepID=A0AAV1CL85_OLDCO|nr:OLC1v1032548C1 [Oldenlandia corymbosa var. corymbosa]
MKSGKGHQEEEDEEEDEFAAKKDTPPSNNNSKGVDGKNNDKANAMRSKHSVTEQRRRSKINERFQILRELIPHSDQKRDTASFLLEVIQYVQYLQEKVQKYEGSYQTWSSEPTKLMPWRNSHWRTQSFVTPQAMKNGSASVPVFPGRFDDNTIDVASNAQPSVQNPIDSDNSKDVSSKQIDQQTDLASQSMQMQMAFPGSSSVPVQSGVAFSDCQPRAVPVAESSGCPISDDNMDHQDDVTIEGGTISISSMYSQRLLNTLTQALQSSGVDLSQATISVQINLGKRANRGVASGVSIGKDHENSMHLGTPPVGNCGDTSNGGDLNQAQKRMRF